MSSVAKGRKKILFFSHAVTMAHFSRPLKWIECLDLTAYDVYLASHPKFKKLSPKSGVTFIDSLCIDDVEFAESVRLGNPIYDTATFDAHVADDIRIMEMVKPDIVIGDFRHSLTVSARIKKIKYVNITNAYWSLNSAMSYPLPEAPIIRVLGEKMAPWILGPFIPIALKFNFFLMAFRLRKALRLSGRLFSDYRQIITDGDVTVYCDTPQLVPMKNKVESERFAGPFIWSMPVELPSWWATLDKTRKRIFLSLGSSGETKSLPVIISALAKFDVDVVVALAGRKVDIPQFPNVYTTDFLPMEEACRDSDLVICNGGSPMSHAALAYGVPTIGIVGNNDQLLNMAHIEKRGAGRLLRYWNLSESKIKETVQEILGDSKYRQIAKDIEREFKSIDVRQQLQDVIDESFGKNGSHSLVG